MGFSFDEFSHLSVNKALDLMFLDDMPSMMWGAPGCGKTEAIKARCSREGIRVIPVMAGCSEPTDLLGIPFPGPENLYTDYLSSYWAYYCSKDAPEEWQGPIVIFLDDITTAHEDTQAAFHKVVYEGISGKAQIRDNVRFIAAGNRPDDKSSANEMIKSLANRFVHYYVKPTLKEFLEHVDNLHPLVRAFLNLKEERLTNFDVARGSIEPAWASPRSWEALSICIHSIDAKLGRTWVGSGNLEKYSDAARDSNWIFLKAAGCVGLGIATEFNAFIRDQLGIIPPEEIAANPRTVTLPAQNDVVKLWSTVSSCEYYLSQHPESHLAMLIYSIRLVDELSSPDYAIPLAAEVLSVVSEKLQPEDKFKFFESPEAARMMDLWGDYFLSEKEFNAANTQTDSSR